MLRRAAAWVSSIVIVAILFAVSALGAPTCSTPAPPTSPIILRIDGTTLAEWKTSAALRPLLENSRAASVLLPRELEHAPRSEVTGAFPGYDSGLGGRRVAAASKIAWGTRSDTSSREGTVAAPAQSSAATAGTFVSSSPDSRPAAVGGTVVYATKLDSNWPTGSRADLDPIRDTIREIASPVEIDLADIWRLDHEPISDAARPAFVTDVLDTIVAPLAGLARELDRPVVLLSVLPSLTEQRSHRWRGAVAVIAGEPAGLLSSKTLDTATGLSDDVGLSTQATMPGSVDVSRVLTSIGLPTLAGIEGAPVVESSCVTERLTGGSSAADLDETLAKAASLHDPAATVVLIVLAVAALLAALLVAAARRAVIPRLLLTVVAAGALILPLAATVEGAFASSLGARTAILASVIGPAAVLTAWLAPRTALGIAAVIGSFAALFQVARGGREIAASMLSAPLYRGLRAEGVEAFLIAYLLIAIGVAAAWIVDRKLPREPAAIGLFAVTLGSAVLLAMQGGPPFAAVLLGAVGATGIASHVASRGWRSVPIFAGASLALAIFFIAAPPVAITEGRLDAIAVARAASQPTLWPLLLMGAALFMYVRIRLSRHHADVMARESFGSPTWRSVEIVLLIGSLGAAFAVAAGTFTLALVAVQTILVGRLRA